MATAANTRLNINFFMPDSEQISFSKLIGLFLAEELRSRRVSLARAAEISRRVMRSLGNINSETDALNMLSEIEKDFEEVLVLKQVLHFGYKESDVKLYEEEIKQYAADLVKRDMEASAAFLKDASDNGTTIQTLCVKYPNFCSYLAVNSDKARQLGVVV